MSESEQPDEDLIGQFEPDSWARERAASEAAERYAADLLQQDPLVLRRTLYNIAASNPVEFVRAKHGVGREGIEIEEQVERLRVNHEASRRFQLELLPAREAPDLTDLTQLLAEPDDDVRYLVDELWPADGKIVLAAQNKSGKTTLIGNLIRSLVDGEDFLGQFSVDAVSRVVLIDNELSPNMIRRWLRDQDIDRTDAVSVLSLRGRSSSFNILDPEVRAEWAQRIGPADVLVFDCLPPALDALGLSEDKDSGRFLEALDELVSEAGIGQLGVVHHMGHSNERSRGDSRIEDWPDAKWKLVKDGDQEDDPRFFSAFGRDVSHGEVELVFNPLDRHLSVKTGGGNRADARASRLHDAVLDYVGLHPGCSQGKLELGVPGDDKAIRRAASELEDMERLLILRGPNRSKQHYLPEAAPSSENR